MTWHLLGEARWAPGGVDVGEDIPEPLFWLHAEDGELRVEVDWERFGPVQFAIAARTDGRARVAVGPRFLAELLQHVGDDEVTLQLPVRYGDPIWVADGDWSMYLMPISPFPSLDTIRRQLEELLRSGYRLEELVADDDGDYPFLVGDATMYVRLVDAHPPVVQVFAVVLRGVPVSAELLRELNDITAQVHHGRVFWVAGQVLAEAEIVASDLSFDELGAACRAVSDILEDLRPLLLARFGEDHEPPWEPDRDD
ncbi:MAG: YbjN domain-containing protein [Actinomycetota bacterium]|nr:YbjN domain-containing protein [Actinomycetota bacterium]